MKEKLQPKYSSKEESSEKKKKPAILIIVIVFVLSAAILGTVWRFNDGEKPTDPENTTGPTSEPIRYAAIETAYGPLWIEEDYADSIRHEEVSDGDTTIEVFYMVLPDGERELFHIIFGNASQGDYIGTLKTDGQAVPVSVTVCTYTKEDFPDQDALNDYYTLMDQVNVVLDSIRASDSFAASGSQTGTRVAELTYWSVELPETVTWEERTDDQTYYVDFFGTIGEENVRLYTISLGEAAADSFIGLYEIDGKQVPVGVQTYSLESGETYFSEYAAMMETINDVIQVIMADQHFSALSS